jgi:hypothetical protein
MILVYLVIALAAWIGLNLCVFLWLYFQAYSRCETLAKVQCHETVKVIPTSCQSIVKLASPHRLFASVN